MSQWLDQQRVAPRAAGSSGGFGSDRAGGVLRAWDLLLAGMLGALLCLPYAWARLLAARVPAQSPANDEHGVRRHRLDLPATFLGRLLAGLGAASWPVVFDVLAGRMSWVGPISVAHLPVAVRLTGIRPGVVTLWGLRQRTAVAYASEVECDHEYLVLRGVRHDLGLFFRSCLLAPLRAKGEAAEGGRVCIGDVAFDNLGMQTALERLDAALAGTGSMQVSFVNPACVNIAAGDRSYRRSLKRAALVLPDGIGIKIGADILGTPLKQNVNGTDLFPRFCALMERRQSRLFLLGGQPGVPEAVAEQIRRRWPGLRIVGQAHGFFAVADEGRIVAEVKASGADVVLVARGVPAQDVFIDRYLPQFGARVVMGVGGLFDFVAGRINRAPQWMRDSGLEWVYRLMQEPGRMWRRYLLGNFSFLARVLLQRMGWRKPATDLVAEASDARPAAAGGPVQAVLFACAAADPSIPSDRDAPASLLPLGCASFLERALEHLSEAGVRRVHLVVSHQPESLRRVVGMGERWGLAVQWHLAKDDAHPYGVLPLIDWHGVERVLVGHAERWVGRQAVCDLARGDAVAWVDDPTPQTWSGWASASPAMLAAWPAAASWDALSAHLHAHATERPLLCASARTAWAGRASDLLAAQTAVFETDPEIAPARQLPGSWIKTPWGGMSPSARVHPQARIQGPVLLGPGCLVDADARIGPDAVLVRDVVVTRGSSIVDAVVLPNTFIGEGLAVQGAVVDGTRLHQLDLGVTIELPAADGLLMALRPARHPSPGLLGRGLAAVGWAVLYLPATVDALWRSARGVPPAAARVAVALDDTDATGGPAVTELWVLREPAPRSLIGRWLSLFHPLADVVQGRRTWLGRRPMPPAQWVQLSDEWRQLLSTQTVGVVHAPAWIDAISARETGTPGRVWLTSGEVAADVFLAVQSQPSLRRRLLLRQLIAHGPDAGGLAAAAAKVPPAWQLAPGAAPAEAPQSAPTEATAGLEQAARAGS